MRQHDLTFANFICTFGREKVLLDYISDIVLPAFMTDTLVRKYGPTNYYLYDVKLRSLGKRDGLDDLAISGHFVKDTSLERQQIFKDGTGIVEDHRSMQSSPSSFFVLLLSDHRLLYFAESKFAPDLATFSSTLQIFMRRIWRVYLKDQHKLFDGNKTYEQLRLDIPSPVLNIVPIARRESITETIKSFRTIERIRFKLIKPNDEVDHAAALTSLRERYAPLNPSRIDVDIADSEGLDRDESLKAVVEAAEGANTEIIVSGIDDHGAKAKADNEQFGLVLPVENPPEGDAALRARLYELFNIVVDRGSIRRSEITDKIRNAIGNLAALIL